MPRFFRVLIVAILAAVSAWFVASYAKLANPFYGDALGYYVYLPATFIYHNHTTLSEVPADAGIPEGIYNEIRGYATANIRSPKGYVVNQYTYGVSLTELPFFLLAHVYEKATGGKADGFSETYQRTILLGTLVYGLLGLMLVYKTLRRYFESSHSFITVVTLFIGTNLFWFMLQQGGMSHIPLFFLYALLIWATIRVHEKPSALYFSIIGFALGLITVMRPTDIISVLIPLLYNVYNKETIRQKFVFLRLHYKKLLLLVAVFMLPVLPQLLYWKYITGHFVYYSYGGQSFNWTEPRIFDGLLSFYNGWLIYTPVMIFAVLGMLLYRRIKWWAWSIWTLTPLYVYIIYSWYCYNYINGLGSRPMIHLYPLLAIPLAAFISFIAKRGVVLKSLFLCICLFFIALNISYSVQKSLGILLSEESNWAYNKAIMFRTTNTYKDLVTRDVAETQPDEQDLTKIATLACLDFEDSTSKAYWHDDRRGPGYFYLLDAQQEHMDNPIRVPYSKQLFKDAKWLKCTGTFMCPDWPTGYYRHLFNVTIQRKDGYYPVWKAVKIIDKVDIWNSTQREVLRIDRCLPEKWGTIWYFVRIPDDVKEGDMVGLEVWNLGKQYIYMDDICLEIYK